jgi:hypothetical protein
MVLYGILVNLYLASLWFYCTFMYLTTLLISCGIHVMSCPTYITLTLYPYLEFFGHETDIFMTLLPGILLALPGILAAVPGILVSLPLTSLWHYLASFHVT